MRARRLQRARLDKPLPGRHRMRAGLSQSGANVVRRTGAPDSALEPAPCRRFRGPEHHRLVLRLFRQTVSDGVFPKSEVGTGSASYRSCSTRSAAARHTAQETRCPSE